jgi:hypothetical protein
VGLIQGEARHCANCVLGLPVEYSRSLLVKYVCDACLALRVFANGATLAKELGVDRESVNEIAIADSKLNISFSYLQPCFRRTLSSQGYACGLLLHQALDPRPPLLDSVLTSYRAVEIIALTGKKIGCWT